MECFGTTVYITVVGTLINMLLTVLMAYSLARPELVCRKFFMVFVLIPLLIGGGMIPTYLVVRQTRLIDTTWAYILPGAVWSYILIIAQTFFAQIEPGMRESALIDGAREHTILFRIILPVSMPILATIGLMYGVAHWNEYFASVLYISSPARKTLQVVLRDMLERSAMLNTEAEVPTRTLQMAGVVFVSAPIIAVYPFLQRYYTQGIMLGAIKG
jgi:putative aldouronate transport system permease protein